ncbi:unnamed protein product [Ixodes pacificus]
MGAFLRAKQSSLPCTRWNEAHLPSERLTGAHPIPQATTKRDMKTVFVTVGTTSFDDLIDTIISSDVLNVLKSQGYTKILLQVGKGNTPKVDSYVEPSVESYNFKDSITRDINEASLVISHAGAGSILQALRAGKKLIAVVNESLLSNHQSELASQLHKEGYLLCCTCGELQKTLEEMEPSRLRTFPEANLSRFPQLLDGIMGWSA